MDIHRHIHLLSEVRKFKITELPGIYWAMGLKTLAVSFVGIFIPIYLYTLGFSLTQIFLFYSLAYFSKGIFDDFFVRIILKYGSKHSFAFSFPLILLYFWLIMTLPEYNWNIYLLALVLGASSSLSWMSYHVEFSKIRRRKSTSKDVSKMQALMILAGATAPFVGGILATRSSIDNTFLLAMGALIFAVFPLFKTGEPHIPRKLNMKKLKVKTIKKDLIGASGMAVHLGALYEVWPLFIFLIVGTYETVGSLESLALILSVITTLYIGGKVNSKNRHKVLERGSSANGILWIIRAFAASTFHIVVLNIIHPLVSPLLRVSYFSEIYMHTDEGSRVEYLLWIERAVDYSRGLLFLVIAIFAMIFSIKTTLIIGLLLASAGAFSVSMLRPAYDEVK